MSSESMLWVNLDTINSNGNSQFLHCTREGICFAFGDRATVSGWIARMQNGENPETLAPHLWRTPWSSVRRFEWAEDAVELSFALALGGSGGELVQTFEPASKDARDAIVYAVHSLGMFRATERKKTTLEILKGPVVLLAFMLVVLGGLFWGVGEHVVAGGGRTRARMALVTGIANFLGYGGISVIALITVIVFCVSVGMGLRNPPTVHTLELVTA